MKEIQKIKPNGLFKNYIFKTIPLAFDESMSYYETLCALLHYLKNTVIPAVDNNADAVIELQNLYTQLKEYVDNYFDNLDVQEEINNKLDAMVESGELQEIIASYLNSKAIFAFDTVNDMKDAENLIDGSYARTLGYETLNDGGGCLYKITETPLENYYHEQLNNGLYANIINDFENNYYDEITYTVNRNYGTDYYITTIPKYDVDNNIIMPYMYKDGNHTPNDVARRNYTTLTMNAGSSITDPINPINSGYPSIIGNGQILRRADRKGTTIADCYKYIGIKADRTIATYDVNKVTADEMLADGCINVFNCYWPLIENGVATDLSDLYEESQQEPENRAPRQAFGVKTDGTIIILSCDGRTTINQGLKSSQMQTILLDLGCINAWNLDGGGSVSTSIKGTKINRNIDESGTKDRQISYTLNVKKETKNVELAKCYSQIGKVRQELNKQLTDYINDSKFNIRFLLIDGNNTDNVIQETNVRQILKTNGNVNGSSIMYHMIEFIKENESDTNYSYFKIKKTGNFKITCVLSMASLTANRNALMLYRNDAQVPQAFFNNNMSANTVGQLVLIVYAYNDDVDNLYSFRCDGGANNYIQHNQVFIEEM